VKYVAILGMHRSGTSAVTELVEHLGLASGRAGRASGASANPHGYFEPLAMVSLNEQALNFLEASWSRPPLHSLGGRDLLPKSWTQVARQWSRRAYVPGDEYVIKEPRLALLMPQWRPVLGSATATIAIVRDPAAVAKSLHRRNSFSLEHSLALWWRYNQSILEQELAPDLWLSYEQLVQDPAGTARTISSLLASKGFRVASVQGSSPSGAVIDRSLDRSKAREPTMHSDLLAQSRAFYQELRRGPSAADVSTPAWVCRELRPVSGSSGRFKRLASARWLLRAARYRTGRLNP
jgi:hypothetical protein